MIGVSPLVYLKDNIVIKVKFFLNLFPSTHEIECKLRTNECFFMHWMPEKNLHKSRQKNGFQTKIYSFNSWI